LCKRQRIAWTPLRGLIEPPSLFWIIRSIRSSARATVISQLEYTDLLTSKLPLPSIRPANHWLKRVSFEPKDVARVVSEVPTKWEE
jgi:hypothetical protein